MNCKKVRSSHKVFGIYFENFQRRLFHENQKPLEAFINRLVFRYSGFYGHRRDCVV